MTSFFSGPKAPKIVMQETPPPTIADTAVQEAAAEAARKRRRSRGRQSTILSDLMDTGQPGLQQTLGQ